MLQFELDGVFEFTFKDFYKDYVRTDLLRRLLNETFLV